VLLKELVDIVPAINNTKIRRGIATIQIIIVKPLLKEFPMHTYIYMEVNIGTYVKNRQISPNLDFLMPSLMIPF
jgi:hypothetical protein